MSTLGHTEVKVALAKSLFSCSWGFTKVHFYGMTPRFPKLVNTVHQLNQFKIGEQHHNQFQSSF